MSRIKSLVRASMTEGMDIFNMRKGGKGVKIFVAAAMFLAFFGWSVSMIFPLKAVGQEAALLSMFVAIASLLTLIEGIYKSGGLLFNCRDDDMLLSLPLSRAQIVGLRIFKFYVFELVFNSLYLVPAMLAYGLFAHPGVSFWFVSVIMIFLLPIIPIAISCVIGALITAFSSRFKKHNIVSTILAFVFMFVMMVFSFKASDFTRNIGNYAGGISGTINQVYYPAKVYTDLVGQFDFGKLLIFIAIHIVVILAAIAFISKLYFRINSRAKSVATASSASQKVVFAGKVRRPFSALMKKEMGRIASSPTLMVNAGFGLILFLVGVGLICFKFDALNGLLQAPDREEVSITLDDIRQYLPAVTFALMAFCSLMSFMTTTLISLEKRAINLTKTLPISAKKILLAKVLATLVIVWVPILIGAMAMIIRFRFGIVESLLLIIAGITLPVITELFGILVDLKHANFDAETDTEIVKQSTGSMISTFFGLGGSMVVIGVAVVLVLTVGQTIALAVIDAVLVAVCFGLYFHFAKICEVRFKELQA